VVDFGRPRRHTAAPAASSGGTRGGHTGRGRGRERDGRDRGGVGRPGRNTVSHCMSVGVMKY
jgi:hypothetical protein